MNNIKTEDLNTKIEIAQETQSCSHQEQTTTKTESSFCCPYPGCSRAFRFYCDIKRHLCAHSNQRPYTCTYPGCSKAFKRPDTLKIHYKSHTAAPSHICPFPDCNVRYNTKAALKSHLRNHRKKNETCCPEGCDKKFFKNHNSSDLDNVNKGDNNLSSCEESCKKIKIEENTQAENSSVLNKAPLESVWDQEDQIRFLKCLNAIQNNQRCESVINCQQNWLPGSRISNRLALIDLLKTLTQENRTLENQIKNIESRLKK